MPGRSSGRQAGYAAAAVAGETAKVAAATPGRRNHAQFCASVALGQLVAGGALDQTDTIAVLVDAAAGHVAAGAFTDAEALATIRSGLATGARTPRGTAA